MHPTLRLPYIQHIYSTLTMKLKDLDTLKPLTETPIINSVYGLLIVCFFLITPWNRIFAEYIWFAIASLSICVLCYQRFNRAISPALPSDIKKINYIVFLIPVISILSFIFTPLDNLSSSLLEPDIRWFLFIPMVIVIFRLGIHPRWVFVAVSAYCLSASTKGIIETELFTSFRGRASGDENPNPFGMFNAMITLMALAYLAHQNKNKNTNQKINAAIVIALISICILGVVSTLLTGTRTAMILLLVGSVIYLIMTYKSKSTWALFCILFISLILIASTPIGKHYISKITSIPGKMVSFFNSGTAKEKKISSKNSTGQRLEQWRGSACVFKKHPLLGTGPRSAQQAFGEYGDSKHCDLNLAVRPGPRQTHSMYFNTLMTQGIGGIVIFSVFFIALFRAAQSRLPQASATARLGAYILLAYILSMAINGIALDMWFRNYMVNKNLMALLLPLILFAWQPRGQLKEPSFT